MIGMLDAGCRMLDDAWIFSGCQKSGPKPLMGNGRLEWIRN